jgi:hypothetical protein
VTTWSSADNVSRAEPAPCRTTASSASGGHVELVGAGDVSDQALQHVGRQEVELEVLGAAADRVAHLLRIGGGEHEHDVARGLLQRLQEGGLGRPGEHVDLVEDVHPVAPRRGQHGALDEVAHGVDAVVRRGVELVDVEAGARFDGQARRALAARLAVDLGARS